MNPPYRIEACVETLAEAQKAEQMGAHQLELCSRLDLDGLTPDYDLITAVVNSVSIPVKVMLRPFPGSFEFNAQQTETLMQQLSDLRQYDIAGVVFGAMKNKTLNTTLISKVALNSHVPVTVHKAIDACHDVLEALTEVIGIDGVDSVLTSGAANTALGGQALIREMIAVSRGRLNIIAAGRITLDNRDEIYDKTNAPVLHGRRIVG